MKRPLCLLCLAFVAVLVVCLKLLPMELPDFSSLDGQEIQVEGRVCQKEYKTVQESEILVIYLHSIHILKKSGDTASSEESKNIKSSIQSQDITQAKASTLLSQSSDASFQRIMCYLSKENRLEPDLGSKVRLEGRVRCFSEAGNPGEFNMKKYYSIQKLDFRLDEARFLAMEREGSVWLEGLFRLRRHFAEVLDSVFEPKEASIMKAMLLGEMNGLDPATKEWYQESSIIHILSISGLHISIIGMGIYRTLRRCGIPLKATALFSTLLICTYAIMTGMSMSAARSVFMFFIHLLADVTGRSYDMITALSMAAVLLLVDQPLYVEHSGFLFSFGAVAGIGVFMPVIYDRDGKREKKKVTTKGERLWEKGKQSLASCVSVFLVTLPVNLIFYYQFPIYSILLNLAVIPLMTLLMTCGLFCMVAGQILPVAAALAASVGEWILWFYEACCLLCEKIPGGIYLGGQPKLWQCLVYLGLLAVLVVVRKKTTRFWKLQWIVGALSLLLLRGEEGLQITMLDVGQGDCIYIRSSSGQHYLIDGGSSTKSSVEQYQLLPYLKSQRVSCLKAVFVTHSDLDHCSGILALLEQYPLKNLKIENLILPDLAEESQDEQYKELVLLAEKKGIPVRYMGRGQSVQDEGLTFFCIHPSRGYQTENANESSLVLHLSYGNFSGLFTGDVEGEGEQEAENYLQEFWQSGQKKKQTRLTLLKVAHHGSRHSTSEEFLRKFQPGLAFISSGKKNWYGHPHKELLERLEEAECRIFQTSLYGAVTIRTDGREYWLEIFRKR
ncbi:MAG: DNA internalization-related competence protein ComEC/Rec2 [Lachnospiraceae bacterium]|nr:DNA internalization-related competence protein ComEC/Rec2 [Lachnospiraceae bacterium]